MSRRDGTHRFAESGASSGPFGLRSLLAATTFVLSVDAAAATPHPVGMGVSTANGDGCIVTALVEDGTWRRGVVTSIDPEGWRIDAIGSVGARGVDSMSIVRPIAVIVEIDGWCAWSPSGTRDASDAQPAGMLVTQDGQSIPGALEVDGSIARWNHRWIGKIPLEVDGVRSLRLLRDGRVEPRDDADVVLLANGDEILGFVESIGSEIVLDPLALLDDSDAPGGVGEEPSDEATERSRPLDDATARPREPVNAASNEALPARSIDLSRVAAVAFVPSGVAAAPSPRAWTRDGTVVACEGIAMGSDGALSFSLTDDLLAEVHAGDTSSNLAADTVGLVLEPARIRPLSERIATGGRTQDAAFRAPGAELGPRHSAFDQLLGLGELRFHGPQSVGIDVADLGGGTSVFTAVLSILEPAPADAALGVELRADGVPVGSVRLTVGRSEPFVAVIPEGVRDLELVLDDGGNGLAGDRLLIRRGAIIVPARRAGK